MKKQQYFLIFSSLLIFAVGNVQGNLIWDSGHHVYSEGTETFVYMYNDASAEITGGIIHEFYMYNETTAEITGGDISVLLGQDTSHVDVYPGSQLFLRTNDTSTANVYGGTMDVFALGSSNTNIYGGIINELDTTNQSIVNLYGGDITEIDADGSSTLYLYVDNYGYNPTGGDYGFGFVTGTWLGNVGSFNISLYESDTINHIFFVPEPGTIILFSIVGFALRHKRKRLTTK